MKKEIRTFALFAVLTLAATSCQKEIDVNPMAISEQTSETIQIQSQHVEALYGAGQYGMLSRV